MVLKLLRAGAGIEEEAPDGVRNAMTVPCSGAQISATPSHPLSQAGPLFLAAESNWVRVLRLLLQHKADCTRKRVRNGWYPLHVAARHGFEEVVEILLGELGRLRTPLQVTARGETAADLATEYGHIQLAKKIALAQMHLHRADVLPEPAEYVLAKRWCHVSGACNRFCSALCRPQTDDRSDTSNTEISHSFAKAGADGIGSQDKHATFIALLKQAGFGHLEDRLR